ncbi:hypothetical protein PFLA_a3383 [Pseudoalteromonas flavipulchra NCIMB 2033 = ATCC BAA-314]|nr:hypothetical protein [Pseudoalteromonas flavipulchra NCIMB 2033 = ATCC BAA-314]
MTKSDVQENWLKYVSTIAVSNRQASQLSDFFLHITVLAK